MERPAKKMRIDFCETVKVYPDGSDEKPFYVHRDILLARSKLFKRKYEGGDWKSEVDFDKEGLQYTDYIFEVYLHLLYTGSVVIDEEDDVNRWSVLVRTHDLASELLDLLSANIVMDELVQDLNTKGLCESVIEAIYWDDQINRETLQSFLVDFAVTCASPGELDKVECICNDHCRTDKFFQRVAAESLRRQREDLQAPSKFEQYRLYHYKI